VTPGMREPEEGEDTGAVPADNPPVPQGGSGGISVGVLTGGAVAAGEGVTAEDRSTHVGRPAPLPSPPGSEGLSAPPPPAPGGISIGAMAGGAVAQGRDATAVDASTRLIDASPELLAAVRTLREELRRHSPGDPGDETSEVDAQLAAAEEEIRTTGQVRRDRLQWLRERLDLGTAAVAGLASVTAVVEQIARLLGRQG